MKFSLSWLKDHLETDASAAEIADRLTAIGLEVEKVTNPAEALAPFRIAKVLTAEKHPQAEIVAHPECPEAILKLADFVGSTSALIDYCAKSQSPEFIVVTESGVNYSLQRQAAGKKFYFVNNENCNCSECPYMKLNTLEKLRDCLANLEPRVELPEDIMDRALVPLQRMLAVK